MGKIIKTISKYRFYNIFSGILVFEKPCGIVIDIKELFGSESKSQVYGHLHDLLERDSLKHCGKEWFMLSQQIDNNEDLDIVAFERDVNERTVNDAPAFAKRGRS